MTPEAIAPLLDRELVILLSALSKEQVRIENEMVRVADDSPWANPEAYKKACEDFYHVRKMVGAVNREISRRKRVFGNE